MCLSNKYQMVSVNQDQIILALKINIINGDKNHNFMSCFPSAELKMQVFTVFPNILWMCFRKKLKKKKQTKT